MAVVFHCRVRAIPKATGVVPVPTTLCEVRLPLGAMATIDGHDMELQAVVASIDGRRSVTRRARGSASRPRELGQRVADALVDGGAAAILADARESMANDK